MASEISGRTDSTGRLFQLIRWPMSWVTFWVRVALWRRGWRNHRIVNGDQLLRKDVHWIHRTEPCGCGGCHGFCSQCNEDFRARVLRETRNYKRALVRAWKENWN